jgi:peptidoglycan hydrolase-like protein with peptidoglycan-binding domain
MRFRQFKKIGITLLVAVVMGMPAFAVTAKASGGKSTKGHSRFSKLRRASWKRHGQQQIGSDRAREIQEALIRERYLNGQPTGIWDARTTAAMRKFQADQGWQSKVVPDSRALIKLGLGPSHENDLNPDLMGDGAFSTFRGTPADIPQR